MGADPCGTGFSRADGAKELAKPPKKRYNIHKFHTETILN